MPEFLIKQPVHGYRYYVVDALDAAEALEIFGNDEGELDAVDEETWEGPDGPEVEGELK